MHSSRHWKCASSLWPSRAARKHFNLDVTLHTKYSEAYWGLWKANQSLNSVCKLSWSYADSSSQSAPSDQLSVVLLDQSAGKLNRKLPAAQRLPLASEEWDQPLSAVGSWDKDAPLDLALCAPTCSAPSGRGLLPCSGEVVHGEVAEQVGPGEVIEHQGQSLRVRLVTQQDPIQVPDPPSLTQLVPLPAGGYEEEDDNEVSTEMSQSNTEERSY